MVSSSPLPQRHSLLGATTVASPPRVPYLDFLSEDQRNTELSHQEALAAAQVEHKRVRDAAIRCIELHEQILVIERLQKQEDDVKAKQAREQQRLEQEKRLREEEKKLRALEESKIPPLPHKPAQPVKPAAPIEQRKPAQEVQDQGQKREKQVEGPPLASINSLTVVSPLATSVVPPKPALSVPASTTASITPSFQNGIVSSTPISPPPNTTPFSSLGLGATTEPATSTQPLNAFVQTQPSTTAQAPTAAKDFGVPAPSPKPDRYVQIHKSLKQLRQFMAQQASHYPKLKTEMGNMRREIRKCIGQLTPDNRNNKKQLEKIRTALRISLSNEIPNRTISPAQFVIDSDRSEAAPGTENNAAELPSLFLYLLNQLSKAIINQFINECGASPKNADPLGVIAAQVFSNKAFHWRDRTLMDILMAKFRVRCPAVFGVRGNERTDQGRISLGWIRENGVWMSQQQHTDRMMGLGVGYASIALRDFSKVSAKNPWPPSNYWTAMANIVNTPPALISDTQCTVLLAMISSHEAKFIHMYGTAAIAALRKALVEFPKSAPKKTSAVTALVVQAQIYKRDSGLDLSGWCGEVGSEVRRYES